MTQLAHVPGPGISAQRGTQRLGDLGDGQRVPLRESTSKVNGQRLYNTCAYCHGKDAQGIQAINAPRMAGMTDWYLASQLKNFREGVRGEHPKDFYGKQMGFMGRSIQNDKLVNDLVAYINTL